MASNSGKKSVLFEKHAAAVEPHLRTLKDWVQLGKESLVLISNSYNMHVKGLTMTQLAQALFDKFRREANPFSSVDDETSPTSFLDQSHASFHSGEDGPSSHVGQENRKRGVATVEESDVHQDDPQEPKRTRVDADFSNFSHDMKVFLRKELQNLVSTQNFVSPQGQGQIFGNTLKQRGCSCQSVILYYQQNRLHMMWPLLQMKKRGLFNSPIAKSKKYQYLVTTYLFGLCMHILRCRLLTVYARCRV